MVRAFDLQVVRKQFYQDQGDARFLREMPIAVSRGTIFDRNGEPLAVSTPVASIWANPPEVLENEDRIPELAKALHVDADDLKQKIAQRADKEFMYIARQLRPEDAQAIVDLKIPGIAAQREYRRYYPSGAVNSHILGFTNIDDHGQEGLELAFDEWLSGKPGAKRVIRDRMGHVVEDVELVREPQPGRDLTLVDRPPHPVPRLQRLERRAGEEQGRVRLDRRDGCPYRRSARHGQPAVVQSERGARQLAQRAPQPCGHGRGRAGLDDEGVHDGRGADQRQVHADRRR